MLKAVVAAIFMVATCVGQSSSSGLFVVRHIKKSDFSLTPAQMREAEKLYVSICAVVRREFPGSGELRPRFTVVVGTERNEVHRQTEIWLKKWNPALFAEGVAVLAFDQVLTSELVRKLAKRGIEQSNAMVDVADLKDDH
jgi:hypothetical protein